MSFSRSLLLGSVLLDVGCSTTEPVNQPLEEVATSARIRSALGAELGVEDSELFVSTDDGLVLLQGIVADEEQKRRAGMIALRAPGVIGVVNELEHGPDAQPPPQEFPEKVRVDSTDAF